MRFAALALLLLVLTPSCRRHRGRVRVQRTTQPAATVVDAAPDSPVALPVTLDDRCKRHDDCVKVELYVEGSLRCCLACGAQTAASKGSADAFITACAQGKEMRECPIYDCRAPLTDALCVAGRCMLRPRP